MRTGCNPARLRFQGAGGRRVEAGFDGGELTSNGGALLIREYFERSPLIDDLQQCFTDRRDPDRVEHPLSSLLRQRIAAIALGYEDLNDHDELRHDPLLALAAGRDDIDKPIASSSTLNRLEHGLPDNTEHRYKKITWTEEAIADYLVECGLNRFEQAPKRIILDADATDDPIHGGQEGRFFHGYYKSYCYLPLYIFWGDYPILAKLRRSNIDGSAGTREELERIVGLIRQRWPKVEIWLRADSGFAREELMSWCENNRVHYILGLARNKRLERVIAPGMEQMMAKVLEQGGHHRHFEEFYYKTQSTWSRHRRVIAKVEAIEGAINREPKKNPRFVVTSLPVNKYDDDYIYETLYCARGEAENRIKEQQLDLFADRTSARTMRANQMRLWLSTFAYIVVSEIRRLGLAKTEMARATCGTIRLKLFRLAARFHRSARRFYVALGTRCPHQDLFRRVLIQIQGALPLKT